MSIRLWTGSVIVALLVTSVARGDGKPKATYESIADQVMCLCGCVATLNHCPHHDCSTVAEMRPFIQKEIDAGKDESTILQELADRYTVRVLAAPPTKGFNLTAWILPGLGLIVGLFAVVVIARRWHGRPLESGPGRVSSAVDPKILDAVKKEMKTSGLGIGH
jgi:cytochrome c-type biogenesis protein CcmH/NrfF